MSNKHCKLASHVLMALFVASVAADTDPFEEKLGKAFEEYEARKERVVPMLMHQSPGECGAEVNLRIKAGSAALLQNVPGAGVDKFEPFKRVLKDGFLSVECAKDYMYYRGDKFGDNKHDYKLGHINVSVVHYDAFVAKEDHGEMTPKKCFEFCRTVPNMGFFGLVNGRTCYCTPYYTPMESDDSQCDAVCEGDHTLRCGGESKSSIFAMHMCDSTKEDLGKSIERAQELTKLMKAQGVAGAGLAKDMQTMGSALQKAFGTVGDSVATGLAQDAKVFAGTLLHKSESIIAAARTLEDLTSSATRLAKKDFGNANKKRFASSDTVGAAENLMEQIDESVATGRDLAAELYPLRVLALGHAIASDGDSAQVEVIDLDYKWTSTGEQMLGGICQRSRFNRESKACQDPKAGVKVTDEARAWWKGLAVPGPQSQSQWQTLVDMGLVTEMPPPEAPELFKRQYHPVMYFVDKAFEKVPATCTGRRIAQPIVGRSADMCSAACDANIRSCVGFQYFEDKSDSKNTKSLCFLLSDFQTGSYYTGCGKSFLQTEASSFDAQCYAKLSRFEGTTLKPDPTGTCPGCFKKLTEARRCYK